MKAARQLLQLCEAAGLLLFLLFLPDIKFRIKCVEVLGIQMFFYGVESLAETLEVHNFPLS